MSLIPEDLKYTKDHEWVRMEDDYSATMGITDHAQEELTDVVFVELPEVDQEVSKGDQIAVVESVKAVSDVYSPLTGQITDANKTLEETPEQVNKDPYGEGWIFKLDVKNKSELDELMDSVAYTEYCKSGE